MIGRPPPSDSSHSLRVLFHRRERDAFPDRAAAERRVADVRYDDAGLPVDALEERRPGCDRAGAADDGIVRIDAEGREEGVHRAAQAAIEAGFTREDFAVRAVDEEPEGKVLHRSAEALLDRREQSAVAVGAHDLHQAGIVQLTDGRVSLGEDLSVAAVRAEDVVVGRQRERHADRRGLLANREVGRPRVVVGHALVGALRLDLVEHRLELPDAAHVAPDVHEIICRERGALLGKRLRVRVDRDVAEPDRRSRKDFVRLDDDGLGHLLIHL